MIYNNLNINKFLLFFLIGTLLIISGCGKNDNKNIGGGYFIYKNKVYLNSTGVEVEGADSKTFVFLYKDGFGGEGPHTFAKDKNNVYGDFRVLFSGFDYDTLTVEKDCIRGCFKDKDASYYFDGCDESGCLYIKDPSFNYPTKRKLM